MANKWSHFHIHKKAPFRLSKMAPIKKGSKVSKILSMLWYDYGRNCSHTIIGCTLKKTSSKEYAVQLYNEWTTKNYRHNLLECETSPISCLNNLVTISDEEM